VIAIRRRDKTPALPWIQRMLAHEPADLLGVSGHGFHPLKAQLTLSNH
jgi:hypothetical protein